MLRAVSCQTRAFSAVSFTSFGLPSAVLKVGPPAAPSAPQAGEVSINLKVCPVSHEDIRSIRGLSLLRNTTGVGGSFGVGNVTAVGNGVTLNPSSQVLALSSHGTWTNNITTSSSSVFDVSSVTSEQAALVPEIASAWIILNKYTTLSSGNVIIRTNHGSSVFTAAFDSIAKSKGCEVLVANEAQFTDAKFHESIVAKGGARLLVSHFSGKVSRNFFKYLAPKNATIVTYNGKIPSIEECTGIDASVTKLIFNNHQIKGFNFHAIAASDHQTAQEGVNGAIQWINSSSGLKYKLYNEEKYLEAILSADAGETSLLTISQ